MKYIVSIFVLFFFAAQNVSAGFLDINVLSQEEIKVGDEIEVSIFLNTEDLSYNTVSGTLVVSPSLELRQIKTGNSIISAWIENPSKAKTNEIPFSGIIPGGYKGNGSLFQIIIVPKTSGSHFLEIQNSFILLNDGIGTQTTLLNKNLIIESRNIVSGEKNVVITSKDTLAPEKFETILTKDANIADGKYVLIFEAVDKGSGVKMYEVLEGKKLFKQAESPYVLMNQKINERIYVKAIDYDGNERISRVETPNKMCIGYRCFNQNITILILIFAFILSFIIWRRQSKELKRISERV